MSLLRVTFSAALLAAASAAATAKPFTLPNETNLRAAPGTKSEVVSLMPKGAEIEVGECDAGWCKVTWEGKEGFAIGRNLGMEPPREASAAPQTRQPQQPDLNRLRRGYEQYFDNQSQGAYQDPAPGQGQYSDVPPRQRQYAERRVPQTPQYDDDDEDGVVYGAPPQGYVRVAPRGYYYRSPPPYYYYDGPRVYYAPAPYYYRRW